MVALSLLVSASLPLWAQPLDLVAPKAVAPPQQPKDGDFDKAESSADALALIGAFANKVSRATTYHGRLIATTTVVDAGKLLSKKVVEIQSSWIGDKEVEGVFTKAASDVVYNETTNGKTTIQKFRMVDDGVNNYRFDQIKNVWSERPQEEGDTSWMWEAASDTWVFALAMFGAGKQFEVEHLVVGERDQIVVRGKPEDEYLFDGETGDLQSYTRTLFLEERAGYSIKVELRWLQSEFDAPLADSVFEWKAPDGAAKVAPASMDFEVYLQ